VSPIFLHIISRGATLYSTMEFTKVVVDAVLIGSFTAVYLPLTLKLAMHGFFGNTDLLSRNCRERTLGVRTFDQANYGAHQIQYFMWCFLYRWLLSRLFLMWASLFYVFIATCNLILYTLARAFCELRTPSMGLGAAAQQSLRVQKGQKRREN